MNTSACYCGDTCQYANISREVVERCRAVAAAAAKRPGDAWHLPRDRGVSKKQLKRADSKKCGCEQCEAELAFWRASSNLYDHAKRGRIRS